MLAALCCECAWTRRMSSCFSVAECYSLLVGTLILDPVVRSLGYFNASVTRRLHIPSVLSPSYYLWLFNNPKANPDMRIAFSQSQAVCWSLCVALILHGVYFALLGAKLGYVSMLLAFAICGFAKAFLFGKCLCSWQM